jgi:hypothetical protein
MGSRYRRKTNSFKVSEVPEELRASRVKKTAEHQQRGDVNVAMRRITTSGWEYDEEVAKSEGCEDVGYYIAETKKVRIGPDDALEIFSHHNYDHNRDFDQAHCTQLSQSIKVVPAIDFAIGPGGKPVLVNGQHSMWAIYMRGLPTTASITIYQCRDEAAIARLYGIFDSNKKRSQQQVIAAAIGAGDLQSSVAPNKLARWAQCVNVAETGFRRAMIGETNAHKVERVHRPEVQEFAAWIESMTRDTKKAKLITQGVGAAFYAMFLSDRPKAEQFVQRYVDGVGLAEDSPMYRLREKMLNRPEGEHGASVCRAHAEMVYSAWRKFCLSEPMQVVRRTTELPSHDKWKVYFSPPQPEDKVEAVPLDNSHSNGHGKGPLRLWGQTVALKR